MRSRLVMLMDPALPHTGGGLIVGTRSLLRRRGWALALIFWSVHLGLVLLTLPVWQVLDDQPLAYIDSSFHQYQMQVARELWASWRLVGYDPWFAAGHLGGVNFNISAKMPALLCVLLPIGIEPAYKLYVAFSAALAPGLLIFGLRRLGVGGGEAAVGALLGVLAWWVTQLHWYHTAGMVAFVLVSYMAFAVLAWALDLASREAHWRGCLGLGLLVALGLFLHPMFAVPLLCLTLPLLLAAWPDIRGRSLAKVVAAATLVGALPNLVWLAPTLTLPGLGSESMQPFQRSTGWGIAWFEATGRFANAARGAKLNLLLWFASAWGVVRGGTAREWRMALGFVLGALFLIVFAVQGAHLDVFARLQPNRQSGAAYLMLILPAVLGVANMVRADLGAGYAAWAGRASLVVVALALLFTARELANEVQPGAAPHHGHAPPEIRGEGDLTAWLRSTLSASTSDRGRILFETSVGRVYDGAHIPGPLARAVEREFIGGPYVFMHHAGFWDGYLFGRPIQSFAIADFQRQLALYNIGWIVVHSEASKAYLARLSTIRLLAQRGTVAVYEWQAAPLSYVLKGQGLLVSRALDRLSLQDLAGDEVILSYHYVPGLQATPPARLEPVRLPGDPQPFIRLVRPPPRVEVRYR